MAAAGQRREKIRLERKSPAGAGTRDAAGNIVSAYAPLGERRARIQPRRGGEEVLQGRLAGKAAFIISVTFDSLTRTLTTGDRAVNVRTGEVYDIRSVLNMDERQRNIDMDAEVVTP